MDKTILQQLKEIMPEAIIYTNDNDSKVIVEVDGKITRFDAGHLMERNKDKDIDVILAAIFGKDAISSTEEKDNEMRIFKDYLLEVQEKNIRKYMSYDPEIQYYHERFRVLETRYTEYLKTHADSDCMREYVDLINEYEADVSIWSFFSGIKYGLKLSESEFYKNCLCDEF